MEGFPPCTSRVRRPLLGPMVVAAAILVLSHRHSLRLQGTPRAGGAAVAFSAPPLPPLPVDEGEDLASTTADPAPNAADLSSTTEELGSTRDDLIFTVKELQRHDPKVYEEWEAFCMKHGTPNTARDPARHSNLFLRRFISEVAPGEDADVPRASLISTVKELQRGSGEVYDRWVTYCEEQGEPTTKLDPARHGSDLLQAFIESQDVEVMSSRVALISTIKELQRSGPEVRDAWGAYIKTMGEGIKDRDPGRHNNAFLRGFIAQQTEGTGSEPRFQAGVDMTSTRVDLIATVKRLQRLGREVSGQWDTYIETMGDGITAKDPAAHGNAFLRGFIAQQNADVISIAPAGEVGERVPLSSLEVGQTMEGTIQGAHRGVGYFVDVGAERQGFLELGELEDGFPKDPKRYSPGDKVQVRVLEIEPEKLWFTMRTGDLTRPVRRSREPAVDAATLASVPVDEWFEGEVVSMAVYGVFVRIHPRPGLDIVGLVHSSELDENFRNDASHCVRGGLARVRAKPVTDGRITFSMKQT